MDPNEALRTIRALCKLFENAESAGTDWHDIAQGLVEAFEALDGWLEKGGFPPDDWGKHATGFGGNHLRLAANNVLVLMNRLKHATEELRTVLGPAPAEPSGEQLFIGQAFVAAGVRAGSAEEMGPTALRMLCALGLATVMRKPYAQPSDERRVYSIQPLSVAGMRKDLAIVLEFLRDWNHAHAQSPGGIVAAAASRLAATFKIDASD